MDPRERQAPASARRPSILVVDADADTRALYRESFERNGYDVVEAIDGPAALAKAFNLPPTVVVTETTLPLLDGFALCEILRSDRTTANTRIIVVATQARPDHVDRARRAGADAVLVKPGAIDTLVNETRRLIAQPPDRTKAAEAATPSGAAQPAKRLSKACARFTTTSPPMAPPLLVCPSCDGPLQYERSHVGGVNDRQPEQWDYFLCPSCGAFQYRQRTRSLRRVC